MASTTPSYSTLHSASYPTLPSSQFPNPPLNFPFKPLPNPLRHRARLLRPLAAVDAPPKVFDIGDRISNLTLADVQKLVEYLQDKLGVSAASFALAAVVEEKTEFDVVVEDVSSNMRIVTIKVVRALTSPALKTKELIEGLLKKFKEAASRHIVHI